MTKDILKQISNLNESNLYLFGSDKEQNPEILAVILPVKTLDRKFDFKIEKIDLLNKVNQMIFERENKITYNEVNKFFKVESNDLVKMNSILSNRRLRKLLIKALFNHKKIIIEYNCDDSLRPSSLSRSSCLGIYIDCKTISSISHIGLLKMVVGLIIGQLEKNGVIKDSQVAIHEEQNPLIRDKRIKASVDTINMFNS